MARDFVASVFCMDLENEVAAVVERAFRACAAMAPALRSERRSWPLERRGLRSLREGLGVIVWRGRLAMKVVGKAPMVALCRHHLLRRM